MQAALLSSTLILLTFISAIFYRTFKNPEKSLVNSAISIALTPFRFFKIGPYKDGNISLKNALNYASRKAKLTDWGVEPSKPNFQDVYRMVMQSSEYAKQTFTNLGFIFARSEMNLSFVRRLKFVQYMKTNPDLLRVKVRAPVFVMGLPRTGTTYMHRCRFTPY